METLESEVFLTDNHSTILVDMNSGRLPDSPSSLLPSPDDLTVDPIAVLDNIVLLVRFHRKSDVRTRQPAPVILVTMPMKF